MSETEKSLTTEQSANVSNPTLPTQPMSPSPEMTVWNNDEMKKTAWNAALLLSRSMLVPDTYRGKTEDCFIALDMANRLCLPPTTVMQQLYVVHGKPAWSGQMAISLINSSGQFVAPLNYVFFGEEGTDDWGCYAVAVRKIDNVILQSAKITIRMAKDEGWLNKNGSKWKTMPEQMLKYRAGAFFARTYCPERLLGLPMADELIDTKGDEEKVKIVTKISIED